MQSRPDALGSQIPTAYLRSIGGAGESVYLPKDYCRTSSSEGKRCPTWSTRPPHRRLGESEEAEGTGRRPEGGRGDSPTTTVRRFSTDHLWCLKREWSKDQQRRGLLSTTGLPNAQTIGDSGLRGKSFPTLSLRHVVS